MQEVKENEVMKEDLTWRKINDKKENWTKEKKTEMSERNWKVKKKKKELWWSGDDDDDE